MGVENAVRPVEKDTEGFTTEAEVTKEGVTRDRVKAADLGASFGEKAGEEEGRWARVLP